MKIKIMLVKLETEPGFTSKKMKYITQVCELESKIIFLSVHLENYLYLVE